MPLDQQASGTIDLTETDYFDWNPGDSPVSIHIHGDAVDGVVRDVIEGFKSLPRRGLEVGGLLLGRVEAGNRPAVWVDRYQRIPCEHRFGPQFILDDADKIGLEKAASGILGGGQLAVVGLYRSHTREGFGLEDPDLELIRRYFSDPSDLVLLIRPESAHAISARFYVHDLDGGARPVGDIFPFRGRLLDPDAMNGSHKAEVEEVEPEPVLREHPRRLIPDFVPAPVEPAQAERRAEAPAASFLFPPANRVLEEEQEELPSFGNRLKKWLPLAAVLLLAGGAVWWVSQTASRQSSNAPPAVTNEPARPLGLSVEPMGQGWQVSWNPNATALHDAHSVQLFVRDGDDQTRVDLSPRDLAAGVYTYQHAGNDAAFRLEVADSSGKVSAESFRFVRTAASVTAPVPKPVPSPAANVVRRTEPKVIRRAPPVVAAGIRPRITSPVPIDVRVHIDGQGRVTSAAPVVKPHPGLDAYLAGSAVEAARLWRFEPARENGKPVPGTQTIHFVFQK